MSDQSLLRIEAPCLLVLNISLIRDGDRFWAEPLWHKDLLLHLVAADHVSLACPVERGAVPPDWLPIDQPAITILPLPPLGRRTPLDLPLIAVRLWRAIGQARIVHTGIAGWPFALGWIAVPIARARGRFLTIGVESSFWRVPAGMKASAIERLKAGLFERINRLCLDAADITFFTTEDYRDSLLKRPRGTSYVRPATWVDPEHLIGADALDAAWAAKDGRLLFAGRLTEAKGVTVLAQALERSTARVDIIGEGDLLDEMRALASRHPDRIRLLPPITYGADFFALLDRYAAIVVPTLSEEQPRVLFDAFSRGVPAIASDTSGNRQLVHEGVEGRLVPAGDEAALAAALESVTTDRAAFADMGRRARATMDTRTHEAMHRDRGRIIAENFEKTIMKTGRPHKE
jgi:glycosyltransferase involved in cell wall biosynthesis